MFRLAVGVIFLVHTIRADNLPEGASCEDDGIQGTCRKAKLCPSYTLLPDQHSEATICSHDENEEIVCCTDCDTDGVSKEATPALTLDGIVWKTGGVKKHYDKCVDYAASLPYPCKDGVKVTHRKVYDVEKKCHLVDVKVEQDSKAVVPERVDFPNLALLGFMKKDSGVIHYQCQGFIISERFIVTTAHCGGRVELPVSNVAVGIDKLNSNKEADNSSWQKHKVKRFIQHPVWRRNQFENDIGLVETETEIKFGVNVLPMCLGDHSSDPEYVQADILGLDDARKNTKVQIQQFGQTECSEVIGSNRHLKDGLNFATQTCYKGFNETEETCHGSSGRPIYVSGDLKCMKYVVGFATFGRSCTDPGAITVYTRIQAFLPWIESVVWP